MDRWCPDISVLGEEKRERWGTRIGGTQISVLGEEKREGWGTRIGGTQKTVGLSSTLSTVLSSQKVS